MFKETFLIDDMIIQMFMAKLALVTSTEYTHSVQLLLVVKSWFVAKASCPT